jgi:hypothetical protein
MISIESQFLTSESEVTIYNLQGQQIFSEKIRPKNKVISINTSEISAGLYLLKITSEGNTITKKLIKND